MLIRMRMMLLLILELTKMMPECEREDLILMNQLTPAWEVKLRYRDMDSEVRLPHISGTPVWFHRTEMWKSSTMRTRGAKSYVVHLTQQRVWRRRGDEKARR